MVEEQRKRVEGEMIKMLEDIDKTYMRKLQADTHRCAATCCDNELYSIQEVHRCAENCSIPMKKAQNYVDEEFARVQNRLQRCVMDCNDKIKDNMGLNPSQSEVNKFSDQFEQCATKCVDNHCDHLAVLGKTIKKVLASQKFD